MWLHADLIARMMVMLRSAEVGFAAVKYGLIYIPTYPCGSIGALIGAKAGADGAAAAEVSRPARVLDAAAQQALKYYTPAVHAAAFALPQFAASRFGQ